MKKLFAILVLAIAASAFANGQSQGSLINATQDQQQSQGQIQGQGQQQESNSSATSTSNSSSTSGAGAIATGGSSSSHATGGSSKSTSSSDNHNEINIAAQERNPVSSANAPALTAVNGTCSGSTSAAAQGNFLGLSFGTTHVEEGCDTRYDAFALAALGERKAGVYRLCDKKEIRRSLRAAGTICPQDEEEEQYCRDYKGNDSVVRRRMGCD